MGFSIVSLWGRDRKKSAFKRERKKERGSERKREIESGGNQSIERRDQVREHRSTERERKKERTWMIRSQEKISSFVNDGPSFPSWMDSSKGGSGMVTSMTNNKKKKVKLEGDRIYDQDGYWLRAACVCVRALDESEGEVLLVSSSRRPDSWIIPGGKMKPAEAPEASAVREAMEEAGVVGDLGRYLGSFDNAERKHRTKVFVLRVTHLLEDFEDKDSRKRSWFPIDDAVRLLHPYKPNHCKYLSALKQTKP